MLRPTRSPGLPTQRAGAHIHPTPIEIPIPTSHTGTATTIALNHQDATLCAAGVIIAASAQPSPSDKAVFDYFDRVAKAITVPIILQDHPVITQVHVPVDLMLPAHGARDPGNRGHQG